MYIGSSESSAQQSSIAKVTSVHQTKTTAAAHGRMHLLSPFLFAFLSAKLFLPLRERIIISSHRLKGGTSNWSLSLSLSSESSGGGDDHRFVSTINTHHQPVGRSSNAPTPPLLKSFALQLQTKSNQPKPTTMQFFVSLIVDLHHLNAYFNPIFFQSLLGCPRPALRGRLRHRHRRPRRRPTGRQHPRCPAHRRRVHARRPHRPQLCHHHPKHRRSLGR